MSEKHFRQFTASDRMGFSEDTSRYRTRSYKSPGDSVDTISPLRFNESSRPHADLILESDANNLPFPDLGIKPYFHIKFEPVVHQSEIDKLHKYILQYPILMRGENLQIILKRGLPTCSFSGGAGLIFGNAEEVYYDIDTDGSENVDDKLLSPGTDLTGRFNVSPDGKMAYRTLEGSKTTGFEYLSGVYAPVKQDPISLRTYSGVAVNRELFSELDAQTRNQISSHEWSDSFAYKAVFPYMRVELDAGDK